MQIKISYPDSLRRVSLRGERSEFKPSIEFSDKSEIQAFVVPFLCELFNIRIELIESCSEE